MWSTEKDSNIYSIQRNGHCVLSTIVGKLSDFQARLAFNLSSLFHSGKSIRFHDARHTHACLMLKQGVRLKIVQERLGHSSIQITLDTYNHVAPGLQEATADQFDKLVSTS